MITEPYVGPRPFTLDDRERFFGRKDDTDEAVSLVMAYPVVLIYALSGVGKSSLVNAGLVPLLREEGYTVLPPARVEGVLPAGIDRSALASEYVFHALSCWLDEQSVPFNQAAEITGMRLVEFVERWLAVRPEEEQESAPVLVFDQFEEIFTGHEARWKERDEFFAQVGEALTKHPELKVVFTLREEFIARLEPFAGKFPRGLRVRKRLERLREDAARAAITKPVELFGVRYDEGVAEKLVRDLLGVGNGDGGPEVLGEFIEPVQLQVVCRNLWDKLPADFKEHAVPGANGKPAERLTITQAHLDAAGEVTTALSNYYNEALQAALQTCEIPEGQLRRWFGETLIAGDGAGLGMGVVGQGDTETIPELAVRALQERYLVRHEKRGAAEWFELSHARFIKPILKSNAAWLEARSGPEATRGKLLQRVEELNQSGGCLEEWELGQAEDFLTSRESRELGDRSAIEAMVQRSREHFQERKAAQEREAHLQAVRLAEKEREVRRQRVLLGVVVLLSALAILGYWRAARNARMARASSKVAKQSSRVAHATTVAVQSMEAVKTDPERAILLALYSIAKSPTPEGEAALRASFTASMIRLRLAGKDGHLDEHGKPCSVLTCAYSRDGRQILSGGLDGRVRIWNAENGQFQEILGEAEQQPADWVWCVAFSPDGKKVALASKDGSVRIWPYPKPVGGPWPAPLIFRHTSVDSEKPTTVHGVAFDPSGTRLLATCHDGTARLWDLASGKETLRLAGHQGFVRSGFFSPFGNRVVTAAQDNTAKIWSLDPLPVAADTTAVPVLTEPLQTLTPLFAEDQGLWDAEFNLDGTKVITAGGDHMVTLWDAESGRLLAEAGDHSGAVIAAKFVDDSTAVSVSIDKTVRVWKIDAIDEFISPDGIVGLVELPAAPAKARRYALTATAILRGHTDFLRSVDVAPDRRRIATSSRDGTARVWQLPPQFEVASLPAGHIVWDAAFNRDGTKIVTAAGPNPTIWSLTNLNQELPHRQLPAHSGVVRSVAWSPDDRLIASGSTTGGIVKICDASSGAEVAAFDLPADGPVNSLAFNPLSRHLVATRGPSATIFDLETKTSLSLTIPDTNVFSASFSPDGTRVITAHSDQLARLWDWRSAKIVSQSGGHADLVLDAAFSPDGTLIATACADGTITITDASFGQRSEPLKEHEGQVRKIRFFQYGPAGARKVGLASAGFDGTVRIWERVAGTRRWRLTVPLPGAAGPLYGIACSPDGAQIVAGGADKVGRLYYRDTDWLFKFANSRITRDLTADERAKYDLPQEKP